jgi:hypothetical protein
MNCKNFKHLKAIVGNSTETVETPLDSVKRGVYPVRGEQEDVLRNRAISSIFNKFENEIFFALYQDSDTDSMEMMLTKQSGVARDASIMQMSNTDKQQNVKFADQMSQYMYNVDSTMDPTRTLMDTSDTTLENFFQRPLKIFDTGWGTGTNLFVSFNPWSLYFNNPRVINRITNFNLMRCKLHIKIVINGNGFQYGRAIATYLPFAQFDNLTRDSGAFRADLVQTSQLPHIYLDPTTSTGGELMLPYFDYRNNMSVPEATWNEMGTMTIRSINALKHANGASDQVTVSVFAWAEDMSMSVLTTAEPGALTPQSGKEVDEANLKGMISGPATAVAKAAGALKVIPQIAPFAVATEVGATALAKVAKALGYCRPIQTKDPDLFNPRPLSSLATTTVPDAANKLTIDDKQELSIDPRLAGLGGNDPLDIRSIAQRESYLTTFAWNIGTSTETLLWNARVDPVTWAEDGASPTAFLFPACAMAAMPFKYWTGTMKFRFQIVCSSFHKGRLKVVYDPVNLNSNEYNTNYLEVIDIADKTDFTIEIGNGQALSLLNHHDPGLESVTQLYSTTTFTNQEQGNGVVGVYVVNELTTPNSTVNNDIEINVFVSMGDDFEVFVPEDKFQKFVFRPQIGISSPPRNELPSGFDIASNLRIQSGEVVPESQNTQEPSAPLQDNSEVLGLEQTNHELLNKVFTGEAIKSFRAVLKRYNLHSSLFFVPDSARRVYKGAYGMFPFLRGNVQGAIHRTTADASYNYCNTVLLHWVTLAHQGWRGSIRYKILPRGALTTNNSVTTHIGRFAGTGAGSNSFRVGLTTAALYTSNSSVANSVIVQPNVFLPDPDTPPSGVNGMLFSQGSVNPNVEFEVPFYSNRRFKQGKQQNYTQDIDTEMWEYTVYTEGGTDTSYDTYCAAGEDFQVYMWTGLPPMYFENASPAPNATT